MEKKQIYLKVITEYLDLVKPLSPNGSVFNQVYFGTLTLLETLYTSNNVRISSLVKFKSERYDPNPTITHLTNNFRENLIGILNSIKTDIENDLIVNIEKQIIGSVVADFISLAKSSVEQNKDVAAVLASAAIEDSLKRYALLNGLQVEDKDMTNVVNALKSQGLIKGPQASLLKGCTDTRNKAFHAQWDKIDIPEVKSLITFAEEFILKNLS